jgi:hypothetical protein
MFDVRDLLQKLGAESEGFRAPGGIAADGCGATCGCTCSSTDGGCGCTCTCTCTASSCFGPSEDDLLAMKVLLVRALAALAAQGGTQKG